jgi:hypothetical protein
MATEIFIEPELENIQEAETAEEWFNLCVEMGLESQGKLADRSEELKAPPYMYIDPKTERIIRTLCPLGVEFKEYDASTIPLDILQEIQKCLKHGWYNKIKIYYDNKSPDPFVVGFTHAQYEHQAHKHLIARWGAELLPFELLEAKAIERIKDAAFSAMSELKAKVDFSLQNLDIFCKQMLSGKEAPKSDFSVPDLRGWGGALPF